MNPLEFIQNLGGRRALRPAELVQDSVAALQALGTTADVRSRHKMVETLSANVQAMKHTLYGAPEQAPDAEQVAALAGTIWETDLLRQLIFNLQHLEFECRKDVVQVVSSLLRKTSGNRLPTVDMFAQDPSVMRALLGGYDLPPIALNSGLMARECVRHEPLARQLLHLPEFYKLFEHIESPLFEVASDAFSTFRDALCKHKALVADFVLSEYDHFFEEYTKLITSENYVTKRQSLKLLSELLLDRANFKVMTRYISSADDFKTIMVLLRDQSRGVQFEAFHVFKIFVANPNRPKPIVDILLRNRDKLVAFLQTFQSDKDDEQFVDEKNFLIQEVQSVRALGHPGELPGGSAADTGVGMAAAGSAIGHPDGSGLVGSGGGIIPRADGTSAATAIAAASRAPTEKAPLASSLCVDGASAGLSIPRADGTSAGTGVPRGEGTSAGGGTTPRADGTSTAVGIPRAGVTSAPQWPRQEGAGQGIPDADGSEPLDRGAATSGSAGGEVEVQGADARVRRQHMAPGDPLAQAEGPAIPRAR